MDRPGRGLAAGGIGGEWKREEVNRTEVLSAGRNQGKTRAKLSNASVKVHVTSLPPSLFPFASFVRSAPSFFLSPFQKTHRRRGALTGPFWGRRQGAGREKCGRCHKPEQDMLELISGSQ